MNQHDGRDQDHGWVDPEGTELLAQTFGAMAGGVDPASPTGPAAAMTAMTRRVRRRRGAKLGGLGGGALALAAVVALGATQLAPPDRSDALPAESSPSFRVRHGHEPLWLEKKVDLRCGMPVADLETTAPGWSVAPAGDIYGRTTELEGRPSTSWGMASTVQEGPEGELGSSPALVWSQGGTVVDLGPNVFGPVGGGEPLIGSDPEGTVEALGSAATTCLPAGNGFDPDYKSPLPEGDYEVRVVAFPQIGQEKWATVVSDPVAVRIDAGGAHSATGTRGGESTIEPPAEMKGELSRLELDRTTDWVSATMTHRGSMPAPAVSVTAQCESSNPEDTVPFEVVLQSTGQVYRSGEVACDGTATVLPFGALGISVDVLDIRVPSDHGVPDGVARFWAVLAPSAGGLGGGRVDRAGGCSAGTLDVANNVPISPNEAAGATAQAILEAALACDYGALVELADTAGTELMVPAYVPEVIFALPETAAQPYGMLAALLGGTTGGIRTEQEEEGGPERETVVWPRVALDEFADSDEAWQEVVDAGLLSAEEAEIQRANEVFGYQGAIVTIDEDGTWTALGAVGAFPRE